MKYKCGGYETGKLPDPGAVRSANIAVKHEFYGHEIHSIMRLREALMFIICAAVLRTIILY